LSTPFTTITIHVPDPVAQDFIDVNIGLTDDPEWIIHHLKHRH